MELKDQQLAIIKTVSHFDVLDYPLTLSEIVKFCDFKISATEVFKQLSASPLISIISQINGLYFLKGRENILNSRHQRYRLALRKLQKSGRASRILNHFPWVRAVAIYSSLSLKNSGEQGDIDLFIITEANKVWSARFYINLILKLLGLRPTPSHTKDRLCASYLVDENNCSLAFANLDDDVCFGYFGPANITFLSGNQTLIDKFYQANNWNREKLPNWLPTENVYARDYSPNFCQKLFETLFGLIPEKNYRDWQKKILPLKYHDNNDGHRVILSKGVIKLHNNDKRQKFNQLFDANFKKVISTDYEKTA